VSNRHIDEPTLRGTSALHVEPEFLLVAAGKFLDATFSKDTISICWLLYPQQHVINCGCTAGKSNCTVFLKRQEPSPFVSGGMLGNQRLALGIC
jgi:hypothetical protein